jgi:hypothetical protein
MSKQFTPQDARSLVERSRAGDQVAMALIIETVKQAKRGNKTARRSQHLIQRYVDKHPPSDMAGESGSSVNTSTDPKAQLALWTAQKRDPKVFAATVVKTAPYVGPWALISAILHGPTLKKGEPLMVAASVPNSKIASCVRRAFRLQRIASDARVPISSYCRMTALELGE